MPNLRNKDCSQVSMKQKQSIEKILTASERVIKPLNLFPTKLSKTKFRTLK